jgi:tetratricopeptide (TPR) repeat protein
MLSQVLLLAGTARAEDPAAAEALFQEGRKLLADGQVAAACEKLKESFAQESMSGTLLNLAACYEKQGRTATAWARFREAVSLAKAQGKADQAAEATRRFKALELELSRIAIAVPEPVPGLTIERDDQEVVPASYGVQVPVDPGPVQVVASAPGYKSFKVTVEVAPKRDKKTVTVPKLEKMEGAAVAQEPEPEEKPNVTQPPEAKEGEPKKKGPKAPKGAAKPIPEPPPFDQGEVVPDGPGKTPWIIGGLGVAAAAAGGVFGYYAIQSNKDAKALCPTRQNCSQAALEAVDRRNRQAMFANIGVGVGAAGVVTAAVWLLVGGPSSRDDDSARVSVSPSVANDAALLWATGKF